MFDVRSSIYEIMPQYNRPPKQKPPKADEFISFFDHVVRYFSIHQNKLAVVVIAGLLALGGYGVYQYIRSHKIQNVALDYYRAERAPAGDNGRGPSLGV